MAHFLVVSFPLPGHINPALELSRRLARAGARVTLVSSVYAHRRIIESPPTDGLSYASFSDGYDDGLLIEPDNNGSDEADKARDFGAQFRQAGARKVSELLRTFRDGGRHVTCLVYSINQTWAADLAREQQIPSVPFWFQPAAVLAVYYHYFHGYDHLISKVESDPGFLVRLPNLPLLASKDVPTILLPSDPFSGLRVEFKEQFGILDKEIKEGKPKPRVLVNTFDSLEREAIGSVDQLDLICIGPLIPAQPKKRSSEYYMEWLDSRPVSSVVYVSFGSITCPPKQQMEEILNGLLEAQHPFLWVIRGSDTGSGREIQSRVDESGKGLVVLGALKWRFWRTRRRWTDQMTNAKLVEDVWRAGVRVKVNEEGVLEGGELKRCLEVVMGGEEMKKNARKWKDLTRESVAEGGSSDLGLRAFVEEIRGVGSV
ncbi:crocetin glucosyltransferase, chloroplastic-like protein [Cinnamomum micranthum f. kanehirae]|uniref:Crocetin glucosyltransferase, chloroplastic-like protein n=1 Tax=Cinnamomum micranthum f. kanehirae TaxID=337451 RepID=A0A3S3QNF5_9MAGN|nr:crocetin glucosyltransferase, chloroplastic-like protein [Cinnamomum micranthum f. kanehirae]